MNRLLNLLSFSCGVFALASVVWILIPAPSDYVWLYSVVVSEWSLWFSAIALIGILAALINYAFYESRGGAAASVAICALAFLISLYPFFSARQAARQKDVSLSFRQYFSGLNGRNSKNNQFKTYVFKGEGETSLKMDVYAPSENMVANGAGVIVVHGGSWKSGGRNDFPQWNLWLAANGYTVFDIDYSLAPQPNYLTATGDIKCAVRYIKEHAEKFGIAPDKLILLGRSAGGHLALLAAYTPGSEKLTTTCRESSSDESVRAVVAFYAPTDLIWGYDNPANQFVIDGPQALSDFLGGNPHESAEIRDRFILASPAEQVALHTPPTLLIHGGRDQLVRKENLYILADKLENKNVLHETLYITYAQHGFDYNFNGWGSQIAKPLILRFLNKNTQNKTSEQHR